MARMKRIRKTIKWEYKPGWNYVRERLKEPSICAKGSYKTLTEKKVASMPPGVQVITCCPKGSRRNAKGRCCTNGSCKSSTTQALRHHVDRFKFRHKDVWDALKKAPPGARGVRIVWGPASKEGKKVRKVA